MQTKSLLPKSPNCIKNTYTLSTFGMYFVFKFNMIGENTPIKLIYSPYSHQIWTSSAKLICTYSFFKVQNKETKNKQPLTAKHHLALWPRPLSDTAHQCVEGWCRCRPPLPSHPQQWGGTFLRALEVPSVQAASIWRAILAGSPTCFFFSYRVSQPRPWGEGTQLLREPPFQTDHLYMSPLQWHNNRNKKQWRYRKGGEMP